VYPSTAKQRLWLTCLGYDVPDTTTGDEARELFEDARNSGRYQEPATESQVRLARDLGLSLMPGEGWHDVAGRLYRLLLLRAWVYSVCRARLGSNAGLYSDLGLSDGSVVAVARQMLDAGMFEQVEKFSTTDGRESDVFYRMSKAAQQSAAFAFVVERLPFAAGADRRPSRPRAAAASSRPEALKASRGCLVVVVAVITGVVVCGLLL
jgi:hypothetical protein